MNTISTYFLSNYPKPGQNRRGGIVYTVNWVENIRKDMQTACIPILGVGYQKEEGGSYFWGVKTTEMTFIPILWDSYLFLARLTP